MRRIVSSGALAALLAGCFDPESTACLRVAADSTVLESPIPQRGVVGLPFTRRLRSPITTCAQSGAASVEVTAPGNRAVTPDAVSAVTIVDQQGEVAVTVTPDAPGLWRLVAEFVDLGARQAEVEVVPSHFEPLVELAVPPGVDCRDAPWFFAQSALVACEQPDASVAVFARDGGGVLGTVPGKRLAAVGDVLWVLTPEGTTLERYVWDGGAARTNEWPGFVDTPIRGVHTESTAVRATSGFGVRTVGTVASSGDEFFSAVDFERGLFFFEQLDGGFAQLNFMPRFEQWAGIEPHTVWVDLRDGSVQPIYPARRPFQPGMAGAPPLGVVGTVALPPLGPLARWPVWTTVGELSMLASERALGYSVTAWPRRELLRASDEFLLFRGADGGYAYGAY